MALGFLGFLGGPRPSPLGQLATRVLAPRLGPPRLVPGPPKRFAQAVGLTLTTVAAVASLGLGLTGLASALLVVFATLELVVGFCGGCWAFGLLVRVRCIPGDTCAACADVALRRAAA